MKEETFTIYETHKAQMFIGGNVCVPVTLTQTADNLINILFGHRNPKLLSVQFSTEENGDIIVYYKLEDREELSIKLTNVFGR